MCHVVIYYPHTNISYCRVVPTIDRAWPDVGGRGPGPQASHQTVSIIFLANERCLRLPNYDSVLLIFVLVRLNFSWSPCLSPVESGPKTGVTLTSLLSTIFDQYCSGHFVGIHAM